MLNEWSYWLSSLNQSELFWIIGGLLFIDGPRYAALGVLIVQFEAIRELFFGTKQSDDFIPSVCVLIVGHNEAERIYSSLASIWGTYPKLDIIVVDDGSTDGMANEVKRFRDEHPGVLLLSRRARRGKSSGLNWALTHATADVVVAVDADSRLEANSIFEIVQPLKDSDVGGVSGTLKAWNGDKNLVTRLQAYEYRQTILVGRAIQSKLGLLGIVSGSFGAFRRDVLQQLRGWDVGPAEDGDLSLRIRRAGYLIRSASRAECYTSVPETLPELIRQRLRWDRSVITFESRKHRSTAAFWYQNFDLSNFLMILDRWFFNIVCVFVIVAYAIWLATTQTEDLPFLLLLLYLCQIGAELIQFACRFWFSYSPLFELKCFLVFPLVPVYYSLLKLVDLWAILSEWILRVSRKDNFVPELIRKSNPI